MCHRPLPILSGTAAHPGDEHVRVMVCGSRSWDAVHTIRVRLLQLPFTAEIMHGGAPGADTIAAWAAEDFGFAVTAFLPDPRRPSPRRYHERNDRMLDQADLVIAFHDGVSRGTASVIEKARKRGIPVEVVSQPTQAPMPAEQKRGQVTSEE